MPQQPGLPLGGPNTSGGNNPAQVAAMQRIRGGATSATDPSQLPQGQGIQGAGEGGQLGQLLAQALQLYVQGQANPSDTEQIRQFFESFVAIAEESQRDLAGQAAQPRPGGLGAGFAPSAPQAPAA